jgi:ABC-type bacteriocin/lantibiotic exporter with double-glycine peptidase domain
MDTVKIENKIYGVSEIVEFVNEDGAQSQYNCGQAAIATLVKFHNKDVSVQEVEHWYPPDAMFGYFGTSKRRVEKALNGYGLNPKTITGIDAVKESLRNGIPGLVLCEFVFKEVWGLKIPSAHWMMAFGYDDDYIYVSNWSFNKMKLNDFERSWKGMVPRLVSMDESMIVHQGS